MFIFNLSPHQFKSYATGEAKELKQYPIKTNDKQKFTKYTLPFSAIMLIAKQSLGCRIAIIQPLILRTYHFIRSNFLTASQLSTKSPNKKDNSLYIKIDRIGSTACLLFYRAMSLPLKYNVTTQYNLKAKPKCQFQLRAINTRQTLSRYLHQKRII